MRLALDSVAMLLFFLPGIGLSRKLETVQWKTKHASPPPVLSDEHQSLLPLVQMGMAVITESDLVLIGREGSTLLGEPADSAVRLQGGADLLPGICPKDVVSRDFSYLIITWVWWKFLILSTLLVEVFSRAFDYVSGLWCFDVQCYPGLSSAVPLDDFCVSSNSLILFSRQSD